MTLADLGPAFAAIDAYVAERMSADGTPGVGLALTDRNRSLRVATYGAADLAAGSPVTADTLFEIGSMSKDLAMRNIAQFTTDVMPHMRDVWPAYEDRWWPSGAAAA